MSEKVLSIIIPSYNMERYLPKCLGSLSVVPELMGKLEVLVVNDGSNDRTSEIAHEFEERHPDAFRVIDKPNGNYGSCINAALPIATGRYVKILDADDAFDSNAFKDFVDRLAAERRSVDFVLTDVVTVDLQDHITGTFIYSLPEAELLSIGQVAGVRECMSMHSLCYRTQMLRDIQYCQTEGISYTDVEWFAIPMSYAKNGLYWKLSLYRYLCGREGQTMDRDKWLKNLWMLERVGMRLMDVYCAQKGASEFCISYMQRQIEWLCETIGNAVVFEMNCSASASHLDYLVRARERCPFLDISLRRVGILMGTRFAFPVLHLALNHQKLRGVLFCAAQFYVRLRRIL